MAKLTKEQEQAVAKWAAEGANLNDIQARLNSEFQVNLTYLDARLLVIELGLKLQEKKKDTPPEKAADPASAPSAAGPEVAGESEVLPPQGGGSKLRITVDQIATPGTMVSGKVTFSDAQTASWYLDQTGRLGLRATSADYKPPAADIPVFQQELEVALQKAGF